MELWSAGIEYKQAAGLAGLEDAGLCPLGPSAVMARLWEKPLMDRKSRFHEQFLP